MHIVAPDVLHRHVKSITDSAAKNLHFQAPEIDTGLYLMIPKKIRLINFFSVELSHITTAVDIYSLGMVTLEVSEILIILHITLETF